MDKYRLRAYHIDSKSKSEVYREFSHSPGDGSEGRLKSDLVFTTVGRIHTQSDRSSASFGSFELINSDGFLDNYKDEEFTKLEIVKKVGPIVTVEAVVHVDNAVVPNEKVFRFIVRDPFKQFDVPLQDDKYGSTVSTSGGTQATGAREGTTIPLCLGNVFGAEGDLVNSSIREYKLHEDEVFSVSSVFDRGLPVASFTNVPGGFRLNQNPSGTVTAKVRGDKLNGNFAKRFSEIIQFVFSKHGITNYVLSDLTTIDSYTSNATMGFYQNSSSENTIYGFLQRMCRSVNAYIYFDSIGRIRFNILEPPEGSASADYQIYQREFLDALVHFRDKAPNLKKRFGINKIFKPLDPGSVAAGATVAQQAEATAEYLNTGELGSLGPAYGNIDDEVSETLLKGTANIALYSALLTSLYSVDRRFYTVTVPKEVSIATRVEVFSTRYGLSAGGKFHCIGLTRNWSKETYKLFLWGQ